MEIFSSYYLMDIFFKFKYNLWRLKSPQIKDLIIDEVHTN
jgi:hypothetical protein